VLARAQGPRATPNRDAATEGHNERQARGACPVQPGKVCDLGRPCDRARQARPNQTGSRPSRGVLDNRDQNRDVILFPCNRESGDWVKRGVALERLCDGGSRWLSDHAARGLLNREAKQPSNRASIGPGLHRSAPPPPPPK
jgi:hypothetical protein